MKIRRPWEGALGSDRLPKAQAAGCFCWVHLCICGFNPLSLRLYVGGLGAESLLAASLQCLQNVLKNNICLGSVVIGQCF